LKSTDPFAIPAPVAETVVSATDVLVELGLATGFLVLIIALHGWFLTGVSKAFSSRFALMNRTTPRWRVNILMSLTIAVLVAIHLFETLVWTVPLWWMGLLGDFRRAYSFVLEAYTTLGETTLAMPERFRLIPPIIATSGLFTFGWTGSVLVYVMSEILKLEASRTRHDVREAEGSAPARDGRDDPARGPFGA
jgi:hypothetical protein